MSDQYSSNPFFGAGGPGNSRNKNGPNQPKRPLPEPPKKKKKAVAKFPQTTAGALNAVAAAQKRHLRSTSGTGLAAAKDTTPPKFQLANTRGQIINERYGGVAPATYTLPSQKKRRNGRSAAAAAAVVAETPPQPEGKMEKPPRRKLERLGLPPPMGPRDMSTQAPALPKFSQAPVSPAPVSPTLPQSNDETKLPMRKTRNGVRNHKRRVGAQWETAADDKTDEPEGTRSVTGERGH